MAKNAGSALKLGQARGAAICAAVAMDLPVYEYAPKAIDLNLCSAAFTLRIITWNQLDVIEQVLQVRILNAP